MTQAKSTGWKKLLDGYPWHNCDGCYPLPAYSEYMPSPLVGRKPLGEIDREVFDESDPYGWHITEIEEEYELRPGLVHAGNQIINNIVKLGKGQLENQIRGHKGENLKDNPYWPPELSSRAGTLQHEKYVTLLPLMLSRTQDDKGRVTWTLFGNSIDDPETSFWKSFFMSPDQESDVESSITFFSGLLEKAYGEKATGLDALKKAGFKILPSGSKTRFPSWTNEFIVNDTADFTSVKYLVSFRPFSNLPATVREQYLSGKLNLLPFPGSLVFWGMKNYNDLKKEFPLAGQLPVLHLVSRNRGLSGLRVTQSGWFHEPHVDGVIHEMDEELIKNHYHRTHRWQKIHRYQDELNEISDKIKIARALFSTDPEAIGLYDKPLARNSHIWTHDFKLLLDGPNSDHKKIREIEKIILKGGLFGYRFYYPPMRTGNYQVFWHRPLVGYLSNDNKIEIDPEVLLGYLSGYHVQDRKMEEPVELWPRLLRRPVYLLALHGFKTANDHYANQTSKNILSLFDSWNKQGRKPLSRTYAHKLLHISKHKSFEHWLNELLIHCKTKEIHDQMRKELDKIIEPEYMNNLPEQITYKETANRNFEVSWWNEIRFLAHGEFVYTDNADIAVNGTNHHNNGKHKRHLEPLGDYFISRYQKVIEEAGMTGIALCGELPFKWQTDFDFSIFGGWTGNQKGTLYERNIIVVIPGKNRKEAVIFGDHYDTAYMEDIYEKSRGGTGARMSANGADDNYSASATLLLAAPILLKLSKEGKLERDIWLIHLTGEEFPSDCMGARNLSRTIIEKNIRVRNSDDSWTDLSETKVKGVFVMDMIGHNRDNDHNIFQISPGKSAASIQCALQAHLANMIWNKGTHEWNKQPERLHLGKGHRISGNKEIPDEAKFLAIDGEVRTQFNPHSSIFNTDGQIFSDVGLPVVLFMENYDINRTGYHDTHDTMENIDLDYGAAFAAIAIETIARMASLKSV